MLLFPVDLANVTYSEDVLFQWGNVTTWGHVCPSKTYDNQFQLILLAESQNVNTTTNSSWSVAENITITSQSTSQKIRLQSDTNYSWFLGITNGWETVYSTVSFFKTAHDPCYLVKCGHGSCTSNTTGTYCNCWAKWHGAFCETPDDTGDSKKSYTLLALLVIPFVGAIFFAFIVLAIVRHRRTKRLQLHFSELVKHQFSDVSTIGLPLSEVDKTQIEDLLVQDFRNSDWTTVDHLVKSMDITESENLCKALVYFFEQHKQGAALIMHLISKEVGDARDPEVMFRSNSASTKCFKFYSKIVGLQYLFQTLSVLFENILQEAADQTESHEGSVSLVTTNYEVNPSQMNDMVDEDLNAIGVRLIATKFFLQITRSIGKLPVSLRKICHHIKIEVEHKAPKYVRPSLGAFFVLRFINTAIAVPESYGLLPTPPPDSIRRELVIITKMLQNLANGVDFSNKEAFMTKFNDWLQDNTPKMHKLYEDLSASSEGEIDTIPIPDSYYKSAVQALHEALERHNPKEESHHKHKSKNTSE